MHDLGDRRRALVRGGERADRAAQVAVAMGLELVREGPSELAILETDDAADVLAASAPALVVAPRRLWHAQTRALEAAGARRVLDGDATVLDVLTALTELAFGNTAEQRRWWRRVEGLGVELRSEGGPARGRLMGVCRTGIFLALQPPPPEGAAVELTIDTPIGRASAKGRVAYATDEGVAVELDACCGGAEGRVLGPARRSAPPGRSPKSWS